MTLRGVFNTVSTSYPHCSQDIEAEMDAHDDLIKEGMSNLQRHTSPQQPEDGCKDSTSSSRYAHICKGFSTPAGDLVPSLELYLW